MPALAPRVSNSIISQLSSLSWWLVFIIFAACGSTGGTRFFDIDFMAKSIVRSDDGRIRGQLASDTTIDGIRYKGGTRITLSGKGRVEHARLVAPTTVGGLVYVSIGPGRQGKELAFAEDGTLVSGMLGKSATINGIDFPAGTLLHFQSKGGWLEHAVLTSAITVNGVDYVDHLYFQQDGRIRHGWLAQDTTLGVVTLQRQSKVTYWPSGELHSGTLAKPHCVPAARKPASCPHPAGKILVFSRGGEVVQVLDP